MILFDSIKTLITRSYYFGEIDRDEVKNTLNNAPVGTFLIRDSSKDSNQKVLCVK
jgi:hypothetical protein